MVANHHHFIPREYNLTREYKLKLSNILAVKQDAL